MQGLLVIWQIKSVTDIKGDAMTIYLDKTASLRPITLRIIRDKATEYPHTGQYNNRSNPGSYLCRRCGLALFRTTEQFHSGCGWPSFDDNALQTVQQQPDSDKQRTEIICKRCHAHLGHVFIGEHITPKNTRHCVNSASLDWVNDKDVVDTEEAIIAGGCFWGVEYFLRKISGVLNTEVGYIGGHIDEPTYKQVCRGNTGHIEALRVIYDNQKTNYDTIIKRFFEIHDPTQSLGQGPDIGEQYQSAIFYYNDEQLTHAQALIHLLQQRGYLIVTKLCAMQPFWPAEDYHQNYYYKQQKLPYCHRPEPRFG
jgi:peptide methionine sulfoxide reductase msrA/msrB